MSSDNPSTPMTASDPKHDSKHQETLKPSVHCVSHDAVSGSLSRSVDDFRPTVFELRQLALFWYRSIWTERWFEIYLGMTDKFVQPYAHERLLPIREAIGDSAWQQIRDEVDAEIRQEIGELRRVCAGGLQPRRTGVEEDRYEERQETDRIRRNQLVA